MIFAYVTGSGLLKSLAGGVAAFLLATAYTWWRLRLASGRAERAVVSATRSLEATVEALCGDLSRSARRAGPS